MDKFSFVGNSEIQSIESLYQQYLEAPDSLDASWKQFFQGFDFALANYKLAGKQPAGVSVTAAATGSSNSENVDKEFKVVNLITDYRQRGHFFTKTNPVRQRRQYYPSLDIENFGLTEADLDTVFQAGKRIGIGPAPLKSIIEHLKQTYCESFGVEFMYIRFPEVVDWLEKKMESAKNTPNFSASEKKDILYHLDQAVGFEQFIHKNFVGQKRFSLEGAEAIIPALDAIIERGSDLGVEEFIIGMAHRGRLNVLTNILRKPYRKIFQEFVGKEYDDNILQGDVKYHLGYGNDILTDKGKTVRVNLVPNPSHLETVGAITQGIARAKIDQKYNSDFNKLVPIVIHGDAALAAQGIVYEVIQMSQLPGYKTGGTVHLVINNQVGFTTNYTEARSSTYCTDIGKVTRCPIIHVNGDDAEAVIYSIKLAMEYRQKFHTDVFVDILCYRKYGHNEGDEPRFTQPTLYNTIAKHPNPSQIYAKKLVDEGVISQEEADELSNNFKKILAENFEEAKNSSKVRIKLFLEEDWDGYRYSTDEDFVRSISTGIGRENVIHLAEKINYLPSNKKFFKKLEKIVEDRQAMITNDKLDWAMGELLAYASLVEEGHAVRLSGQDCVRGTFSHRHASFVVEDTEEKFTPLQHISDEQAPFTVYNSLLSEYGVLGFEYGYSMSTPKSLTIWEAQFGDFHNVAQPVIDQYITSAEEKWGMMNGLVMLLPHGFEGQGSEHSSARMERFLTMSANNNMQIVNCTTPANFFHVLRRQVKREFRTPLIVFTPKSLLRHSKCVSSVQDLAEGSFQEVIDDSNVEVDLVTRVVYCTGKIYYDLLERKEALNAKDVALIRLEQIHPFPMEQVKQIDAKYKNSMLSLWVQEEPENMGAWNFIKNQMTNIDLISVSRIPSGSPAVGLHYLHLIQQQEIINKVFRVCDCDLKNHYCSLHCVKGKSREEILKQHYYLTE